jgi:ribonuclease J
VDHSIPAAYGFIIETSEGSVIYTGDVRKHGPKGDMTTEFAEAAYSSQPSAMICEGTRMVDEEKRKNYTEYQVKAESEKIVSATNRIVFVTRYSRDMDRFNTFFNVARSNDRRLIVSPKTAYLLSQLVEDKHLDLPDPLKDDDILVYFKRKKSGSFIEKDYYVWERAFMDKMVTHKFVHDHQDQLVMDLDFYQFAELVDIQPDPGGEFIHSMSEPFSEEDLEEKVMHNWLNHFGLRFHQLHASGHMNRAELTAMISHIRPRRVFPIHTENPQLFPSPQTEHVEYGRECKL